MSKHFQGFQTDLNQKISFFDFWRFIGEQLGDARLSINHQAHTIHQLIDPCSDHPPYLREAITQSYKRSRCHHLGADINLIAVLDVLGEIAYQLQGKSLDDLLDIELLEEIAWHISERFGEALQTQLKASQQGKNHAQDGLSRPAQVIALSKVRIKRLNQQL